MVSPDMHPNIEILRSIYADLSRINDYDDDDIVLHTAERENSAQRSRIVGKKAVLAKELDLIRLTHNTLVMDVKHIIANDHFGAVLGIFRAHVNGKDIGMPFCGLWRFRNGRIVEHWENAYDPDAIGQFLMGSSPESAEKAKATGKHKAHKLANSSLWKDVLRLAAKGTKKVSIAQQLKISKSTLYRILATKPISQIKKEKRRA